MVLFTEECQCECCERFTADARRIGVRRSVFSLITELSALP
jgi:hypothetical protein